MTATFALKASESLLRQTQIRILSFSRADKQSFIVKLAFIALGFFVFIYRSERAERKRFTKLISSKNGCKYHWIQNPSNPFSHPFCVIMRGLPGSGKTTKVRELQKLLQPSLVISTDQQFTDENQNYLFDAEKLESAHEATKKFAFAQFKEKTLNIFIDNTNLKIEHLKPFFKQAKKHNYNILIYEAGTAWAKSPVICAEKGSHNLEERTLQTMLLQWEELKHK